MTVWIKQGVIGGLSHPVRKALGRIAKFYKARGEDLYITSKREGNHGYGSLHYEGNAIDFRYPAYEIGISWKQDLVDAVGTGYDVVFEGNHIHVEYDPR